MLHNNTTQEKRTLKMKKKSILALVLSLIMVFSITTPALAATKPSTKTIAFEAGDSHYEGNGDPSNEATIKVTNVTSQKTKDFSFYLSDDDKTISGKKSKVIYCKTKTTITLVPNKEDTTAGVFGFMYYYDSNKVKASTIAAKYKYYSNNSEIEEVDTSKKYDKAPGDDWVVADGSSITLTKAGTYVIYVRPYQFYGTDQEDYELTPVFIIVK